MAERYRFFVEAWLKEPRTMLCYSDYHHCPHRADYFSEDVERTFSTRKEAQDMADRLTTASPYAYVEYGVGEIVATIPADDTEAEGWHNA